MPKTMFFLFDGTANDATTGLARYSNVYAINQIIADRRILGRGKVETQVTFYLPGVGTKFTVRRGVLLKKYRGYLFGDGLEQMILRAYVNLSANFHEGDEVVLIGFSRGAVAARIFSRLISDFGILSSDMLLHLDELWDGFVDISPVKDDLEYVRRIETLRISLAQKEGKAVFHKPKKKVIRFLGVFDTVAGPMDIKIMEGIEFRDLYPAKSVKHIVHILSMNEIREEFILRRFKQTSPQSSSLKEIWIPGVHCDIGGGYNDDLISNISLLTMCDLMESLGGVALDKEAYSKLQKDIREKAERDRFVVNAEPRVGLKKKRNLGQDDVVHPLHWHLLNKDVFWKNLHTRSSYVNRIGKLGKKSTVLEAKFKKWLGIRATR
jgi:uncharacterized protein (DUF2235 family)